MSRSMTVSYGIIISYLVKRYVSLLCFQGSREGLCVVMLAVTQKSNEANRCFGWRCALLLTPTSKQYL